MDWAVTLGAVAGAGALAVFAGWRGARPPNLVKGPRLIPWRAIMLSAAVIALFAAVHAVNLLGVETGRQR